MGQHVFLWGRHADGSEQEKTIKSERAKRPDQFFFFSFLWNPSPAPNLRGKLGDRERATRGGSRDGGRFGWCVGCVELGFGPGVHGSLHKLWWCRCAFARERATATHGRLGQAEASLLPPAIPVPSTGIPSVVVRRRVLLPLAALAARRRGGCTATDRRPAGVLARRRPQQPRHRRGRAAHGGGRRGGGGGRRGGR